MTEMELRGLLSRDTPAPAADPSVREKEGGEGRWATSTAVEGREREREKSCTTQHSRNTTFKALADKESFHSYLIWSSFPIRRSHLTHIYVFGCFFSRSAFIVLVLLLLCNILSATPL